MQDIDTQAAASAKVIVGDINRDGNLTKAEALQSFDTNKDGHITYQELGGLNGLVGDKKTVKVDGQSQTMTTVGGVAVESQGAIDMARLTADHAKLKASKDPKDQQKAKDLDNFFAMDDAHMKTFIENVQVTNVMAQTGMSREDALKEVKQIAGFQGTPSQGYQGILTVNEKQKATDTEELDFLKAKNNNNGVPKTPKITTQTGVQPRGVDLPGQIPTVKTTPSAKDSGIAGAPGTNGSTTPSADMGMGSQRYNLPKVEGKASSTTYQTNATNSTHDALDGLKPNVKPSGNGASKPQIIVPSAKDSGIAGAPGTNGSTTPSADMGMGGQRYNLPKVEGKASSTTYQTNATNSTHDALDGLKPNVKPSVPDNRSQDGMPNSPGSTDPRTIGYSSYGKPVIKVSPEPKVTNDPLPQSTTPGFAAGQGPSGNSMSAPIVATPVTINPVVDNVGHGAVYTPPSAPKVEVKKPAFAGGQGPSGNSMNTSPMIPPIAKVNPIKPPSVTKVKYM